MSTSENSGWKSEVKRVLLCGSFAVGAVLLFQNCSTSSDPSPFEFHSPVGAASSAPTQSRLDSPAGVMDQSVQDAMISVGGGCNVGTTNKHYIEFHFLNSLNQPLAAREDSLCPASGSSDPNCQVSRIARCEHGKYYATIPINCRDYPGAAQGLYRLTGQLVTIDSSGVETRDPGAYFERQFQIAWDNSCAN